LIAEFTAHNVALVVPAQGIDTSGANSAARLQLNILYAIAEFERDLIRERTLAGLAAAKRRGAQLGRPRTIDNYRDRVVQLRANGLSKRAIAKALGIPVSNAFRLIADLEKGPEGAKVEGHDHDLLPAWSS
jgi:putative DNA-invertase from lambdoid prophage Rac